MHTLSTASMPAPAGPPAVTHAATIWQDGRLVAVAPRRRFELRPDHVVVAVLLLASAVVLALFVSVLEREMARNQLAHAQQLEHALAEARCDALPGAGRVDCLAQLAAASGAPAVAERDEAPPNDVYEHDAQALPARMTTAAVAGFGR